MTLYNTIEAQFTGIFDLLLMKYGNTDKIKISSPDEYISFMANEGAIDFDEAFENFHGHLMQSDESLWCKEFAFAICYLNDIYECYDEILEFIDE